MHTTEIYRKCRGLRMYQILSQDKYCKGALSQNQGFIFIVYIITGEALWTEDPASHDSLPADTRLSPNVGWPNIRLALVYAVLGPNPCQVEPDITYI